MSTVKQFPARVRSEIDVNIPSVVADAYDIEEGDMLVLEVVIHKRDEEILHEAGNKEAEVNHE